MCENDEEAKEVWSQHLLQYSIFLGHSDVMSNFSGSLWCDEDVQKQQQKFEVWGEVMWEVY